MKSCGNGRKENGFSFLYLCPLALSMNIKDTAGCSVLIKQVSVHKQLINKRRPSPLSDVFACLFHFMTGQYYTLLPWIATSVYYAHGSGSSDRHNDTIVTLPHMPQSHLPCDPGVSWHISGTESVQGNRRVRFFLITAAILSVCRMWCHQTDAFRNFSLNGHRHLCLSQNMRRHLFFFSYTTEPHSPSPHH